MAEEEVLEESAGKKNPIILFIIVCVVLIAASVGGTVFFLSGGSADEEELVEELDPQALYYALNPAFVSGYNVKGRQREFKLGISLMTREQEVVDALTLHAPTVISKLTILLDGQDSNTLQTADGRESLRQQCLESVQSVMNQEIGKPGVEKVLFTEFVMD